MGGRVFDRIGDAGRVAGPFTIDVHIPGYITGRPCASFLRPQDRDLFYAAIKLREAIRDKDKAEAKKWLDKIHPHSEQPSPLVWEREERGEEMPKVSKLKRRKTP